MPSLLKMWTRCVLMVAREKDRRAAMSGLLGAGRPGGGMEVFQADPGIVSVLGRDFTLKALAGALVRHLVRNSNAPRTRKRRYG